MSIFKRYQNRFFAVLAVFCLLAAVVQVRPAKAINTEEWVPDPNLWLGEVHFEPQSKFVGIFFTNDTGVENTEYEVYVFAKGEWADCIGHFTIDGVLHSILGIMTVPGQEAHYFTDENLWVIKTELYFGDKDVIPPAGTEVLIGFETLDSSYNSASRSNLVSIKLTDETFYEVKVEKPATEPSTEAPTEKETAPSASMVYTVKFDDGSGNILKTEEVAPHGSAHAPDNPVREGYTFKGWDKGFKDVTSDLHVTALWEKEGSTQSPATQAATTAPTTSPTDSGSNSSSSSGSHAGLYIGIGAGVLVIGFLFFFLFGRKKDDDDDDKKKKQ